MAKKIFTRLCVILVIFILGFGIYSNTFHTEFVFDDSITIENNNTIRSLRNLRSIWHMYNTRFITGLSFAINYHFGQLSLAGYHLVNIIIHILAALFVYELVLLTLRTPLLSKHRLAEQSRRLALVSVLFFLTHPIQTKGVIYVTQRAASLAGLFYLAALTFYVKSRLESRMIFRLAAFILTVIAMFTKENTATIPLMLVVYEIFFLNGEKDSFKEEMCHCERPKGAKQSDSAGVILPAP